MSRRGMTASGYCSNAKQCEGKMSWLFVNRNLCTPSGNIHQQHTTLLPPSHHSHSLTHTSIAFISYPRAQILANRSIRARKRTQQSPPTHINNGLQPFQLCREQHLGRKAREDECAPSDDGEQVARKRRDRRVSFCLHPLYSNQARTKQWLTYSSFQQQQPYKRIRIALRRHHESRQPKTLGLQAKTDEQVVSFAFLFCHCYM
jgi:hypothetical protein